MLEAIKCVNGELFVLNQLSLPGRTEYDEVKNVTDGFYSIKEMKVRGAPAIGIVAALSLAVEINKTSFDTKFALHEFVCEKAKYLKTARPTAVNLERVLNILVKLSKSLLENDDVNINKMRESLFVRASRFLSEDVDINKRIGEHGGKFLISSSEHNNKISVLTHCNTGSLATGGYGTALGVIRWLHEKSKLDHAFFTETRPYNQGSRLTAYELLAEQIPSILICDSMVAAAMRNKKVSAVIVGADRVVKNGDTANKIGTYQIAVCAKHHGIPFYVACPLSSIDFTIDDGSSITIEERAPEEITMINNIPISASGVKCWNPAFDVTPSELITGGIITECGVFPASSLEKNQDILSYELVFK